MRHIAIYRIEPQPSIELRIHFHSKRFCLTYRLSRNRFRCCSGNGSFLLSASQKAVEPGGLTHIPSSYVLACLRISTMPKFLLCHEISH